MNHDANLNTVGRKVAVFRPQRFAVALVLIGLAWSSSRGQPPADAAKSGAKPTDANASAPPPSLPPAAPSESELKTERVTFVGPDTYILLDAEGRPQPMPGMTYEDFLAAWKKLNQPRTTDGQPGYSIESISLSGRVVEQRAELECQAAVRLLADGPANIPLGLGGAILQGEPEFIPLAPAGVASSANKLNEADKRSLENLFADPVHGGYVARLDGHAGDRRTLKLRLIVPLVHDGPETTLAINFPHTVASQLALEVGSKIAETRTNTGTLLASEATSDGGTIVRVAGPSGLFRMTWQSASKDAPAMASVLHAVGAIRITVDGRGIRSDARLTVRSYGGSFDQIRVRLPVGAQLIQDGPEATRPPEAPYRLRLEPESARPASGSSAPPQQVVVVELPEKQQGPVVVDFATELTSGGEDRNQNLKLSGFEVLGAVRQFGDVSLTIADDWQARWEPGSYVRQVDPSELESSLQATRPTAAFQYDRQLWSLDVQFERRRLRVHVTPQFELECLPHEARLVVKLGYQVFGARAFKFRVELNGWEMTGDPVESGSLVDLDGIVVTPEGSLLLPLVQASSRRAEVSFTLRRPVSRDTTRLKLPLPVPVADSIGTGELLVRAAPELDLLPDIASSTGLSVAPIASDTEAPRANGAAEFSYRTLLPAAVFVADRSSRRREVLIGATAQISSTEDSAVVDQRLDYDVRYDPVSELTLEVPTGNSALDESLEVSLVAAANGEATVEDRGTPLVVNPVADEGFAVDEPPTRQLRATLPGPRLGKFSIHVRFQVPLLPVGGADTHWMIPMASPVDGELVSHEATLVTPRGLTVESDAGTEGSTWKLVRSTAEQGASSSSYSFTANGSVMYLPVVIHPGGQEPLAATVIERAWLQSWFTKGMLQNRITFLLRTTGQEVMIELPPDAATSDIEVLVDRRPAQVLTKAPGRVAVRLTDATNQSTERVTALETRHTVELRTRQPFRHGILTRHRLTPPQIEGSNALSQVYWHIVLPADEHILAAPAQMTSASQWQWLGAFWGQRPAVSQTELENWSGASQQLSPLASQNEYLFTGLLPVASIELTTAPRWLIVLIVSAAVLALATTLLYVPAVRRSWLVLAMIVIVSAAAVAYPATAFLLAQAGVVGVVLSLLSVILAQVTTRTGRSRVLPVVSPGSQRVATPRIDTALVPPFATPASSVPAGSFRLADSER